MPRRLRQRADGADRQGLLRGSDRREAWARSSTTSRAARCRSRGRRTAVSRPNRLGGATTLKEFTGEAHNGSVALALELGDTVARITGEPISRSSSRSAPGRRDQRRRKRLSLRSLGKKTKRFPKSWNSPPRSAYSPRLWKAPRSGKPDDLKRISGIGPKLENALNAVGYYHFDQIAGWTDVEIAWIDDNVLEFRGRITRDDWVGQAKAMVEDDGGPRNRADAATD